MSPIVVNVYLSDMLSLHVMVTEECGNDQHGVHVKLVNGKQTLKGIFVVCNYGLVCIISNLY